MWAPGAINITSPVHIAIQAEREEAVNIHIAEEHYERYLDQEEEYMREAANNDDITIVCIKDVPP